MKKIWSYKLTVIVTLLILYGILMPGDSVPSVPIPGLDKVVHMGMFFVFTAIFSFEHLVCTHTLPSPLRTLGISSLFAVSTELMQGILTTSRACDPKDLLADLFGIFIALIFWYIVYSYFPKLIDFVTHRKS